MGNASWLLSGMSNYHDRRGYFFGAPHLNKDPRLRILPAVPARDDGKYQLELGTLLPDLFPNLESRSEYLLSVSVDRESRALCFSNVMARLRYAKDGESFHALVPRCLLAKVQRGEVRDIAPPDAAVELLRTFVTARYEIDGTSAEAALESHCERCIHDLIERLNRCLKVLPFVDVEIGIYSVAYSRGNLSPFYFVIKGASDDKLGHGWISPHVGRSILNPSTLSVEQAIILSELLGGTRAINEVESLLHSAQAFLDGGIPEYVLLLSVIAAEVATQQYVHSRLLAANVSKKKLDDVEKDLTYSLMLNVVLFAVAPKDNPPDKQLLGKMNRARTLRNAYMHNAELPCKVDEVAELFEYTKTFVAYLRDVALKQA